MVSGLVVVVIEKRKTMSSKLYTHFDGMCWPVPGERMSAIEWTLRYGTDYDKTETALSAASIVAAYKALLEKTQKDRNKIVQQIKGINNE